MGTRVDTFSDTFRVRKPTSCDMFGHVRVCHGSCRDKVYIMTNSNPFAVTCRWSRTSLSIRMWDAQSTNDSWLENTQVWGKSMGDAEKNNMEEPVIRLGVSTCLLGEQVRYDGGHKLDRYLTGTLGQFFEWVPVCPEVEIGLPTPRESMRLVGEAESPRLVAPKSGTDYTDQMKAWAQGRLEELAAMDLCGFVAKKDSPSSGLFRVKVYNEHGMAQRNGTGIFPRELMNRFPLLPLEEEGRLNDMPLRENFVERVFAYYRWTRMLDEEPTPGGLVPGRTVQGRQVPHRAQADADGSQSEALHRDGPSRRRRGQAGLGGIDSRVWVHAHGRPRCDGYAG